MQRYADLSLDQAQLPPHLERFVVAQEYGRYTEMDQAVWRFVVLQLVDHLKHSAHPAYLRGMQTCGLLDERIPRIEDVHRNLSRSGWGAVCVDGFIPPRVFAELQALGVLAIAADIRSHEHVEYTPAPDIIHEAAGHAPILVDGGYARYLRRFGAVSARAFARTSDREVDDAIHALSVLKESASATRDDVEIAQHLLDEARQRAADASDVTRLSRLYWWTAEYGLVGTPSSYRLYGAGLLSSLGESHSCHDQRVEKRWLEPSCVDVAYDITAPQPQLFVTADFAMLESVLDEVRSTLAHEIGGATALAAAVASEEPCVVELDHDVRLHGTLSGFTSSRSGAVLEMEAGWSASVAADTATSPCNVRTPIPVGRLHDGEIRSASDLERRAPNGQLRLDYASGARVDGALRGSEVDSRGRRLLVHLTDVVVLRPDGAPWRHAGPLALPVGLDVRTAHAALSTHPDARGPTARASRRVAERPSAELLRLRALYEAARRSFLVAPAEYTARLYEHVHSALVQRFPAEWLLRWNLLESLKKAHVGPNLQAQLTRELEGLEEHYHAAKPIDTGLRHLSRYDVLPEGAGGVD